MSEAHQLHPTSGLQSRGVLVGAEVLGTGEIPQLPEPIVEPIVVHSQNALPDTR